MAVLEQQDIRRDTLPALPLGRKVPRGSVRWYLASCPVDYEQSICDILLRAIPRNLLEDAFVLRRERVRKYKGVWVTNVRDLFKGYLIVVTRDVLALNKAMQRLTFPVSLVGPAEGGFAPVTRDVQAFIESVTDDRHVICMSKGEIVHDALRVLEGPLVGEEERVVKIVRKKAFAIVRAGEKKGDDAFLLTMPLAVLARR